MVMESWVGGGLFLLSHYSWLFWVILYFWFFKVGLSWSQIYTLFILSSAPQILWMWSQGEEPVPAQSFMEQGVWCPSLKTAEASSAEEVKEVKMGFSNPTWGWIRAITAKFSEGRPGLGLAAGYHSETHSCNPPTAKTNPMSHRDKAWCRPTRKISASSCL